MDLMHWNGKGNKENKRSVYKFETLGCVIWKTFSKSFEATVALTVYLLSLLQEKYLSDIHLCWKNNYTNL